MRRTEQHDGGGARTAVPALADIGALRLLAHRVQAQLPQRSRQIIVPIALRRPLP